MMDLQTMHERHEARGVTPTAAIINKRLQLAMAYRRLGKPDEADKVIKNLLKCPR